MGLHSTFSKVSSPSHLSPSHESPENAHSKDFFEGSVVSQQKEMLKPDDILEARKTDPLADNFGTSKYNNIKLASEMDNSNRARSDETSWNISGQSKLGEKLNNALEILNKQEPPLHSVSEDESDGSDVAEHDVNVCDICGDAGRENELAICSRCGDGAEHTYCMREMLDEVPEGDWLCEECKFSDQAGNQKHCKFEMVGEDEKNLSSDCPITNCIAKFDSKNDVAEDNINIEVDKANKASQNIHVTGKRRVNSYEFSPVPKKQALDVTIGSPKASSPHRTALLSRDCSFKSLDNGSVKSSHSIYSAARSIKKVPDASLSSAGSQFQKPKGSLLKSKSFGYSNVHPIVKPVNEDIPQMQKGFKESSKTHEMKDAPLRSLGKSTTFKSGNSSRPNATGAKVQMLSNEDTQELKGSKQPKKQNRFIRRNPFKMDHSTTSRSTVSTLKDQRFKNHFDDISGNDGDLKDVHPDGGLINSSKPKSYPTQELSQCPDAICDVKKQSSFIDEMVKSDEKKPNEPSFKDEPLIGCSSFKGLHHIPQDSVVSEEKNPRGQICSSGSKLKAAIEAALLKKPGLYKKKLSDPPDGITVSTMDLNCRTVSQGLFSDSQHSKKLVSQDLPSSNAAKFDKHILSAGNFTMGNSYHGASVTVPIPFKISVIPENKYIWQGGFEMCRSGEHTELCIGIQAHLSTFASPKVLDVVCKFSEKLPLNEVARMNVWPLQFHNNGANDDNIAVFFFAKDLQSYERNYKCLLDSMMRDDLALKGNLDGVELLIFPSNQLPEKSQRWNMLFFLWGVFRKKRASSLDNITAALKPSILPSGLTSNGNCDVQTPPVNANLPKHPHFNPSSPFYKTPINKTPFSTETHYATATFSLEEARNDKAVDGGECDVESERSFKEEGEWSDGANSTMCHLMDDDETKKAPNLELALGAVEPKPLRPPLFLKGGGEEEAGRDKGGEDSSSLSLSLSFPPLSGLQSR